MKRSGGKWVAWGCVVLGLLGLMLGRRGEQRPARWQPVELTLTGRRATAGTLVVTFPELPLRVERELPAGPFEVPVRLLAERQPQRYRVNGVEHTIKGSRVDLGEVR